MEVVLEVTPTKQTDETDWQTQHLLPNVSKRFGETGPFYWLLG